MSITLNDIQKAKERIAPYITETPLLRLHSLDAYLGCQVYAKAECMQITGAFKLRGALNKICQLTEEQLQRGNGQPAHTAAQQPDYGIQRRKALQPGDKAADKEQDAYPQLCQQGDTGDGEKLARYRRGMGPGRPAAHCGCG